jgi:KDO2-lipid IV(A) lauroyltransferase
LKNDIIFHVVHLAIWCVGLLPVWLAGALGMAVGRLGWLVAAGERRKVMAHLAIAFPHLDRDQRSRLGRQAFSSLGRRAGEICCLPRLDVKSYVRLSADDRRIIDRALAQDRGLLWVTAHLGNWELLAAGLAAHGYPVTAVGKQSYDPRFTALIERWRAGQGVTTLWRGRPELGRQVMKHLRQGAILGLLLDQDTAVPGCFVPFFGKLAWTPKGAAELRRRSGAPLLVGFIHRLPGGGHRIRVEEPDMASTRSAQSPAEATDQAVTASLTNHIEEAIRAQPTEWVWMHERWRTQPVVSPSTGATPTQVQVGER